MTFRTIIRVSRHLFGDNYSYLRVGGRDVGVYRGLVSGEKQVLRRAPVRQARFVLTVRRGSDQPVR